MPGYKCTKCDETMHSKNPQIRQIFPADTIACMLTNIINVESKWSDEREQWTVTLEFPYAGANKELPSDEVEMQALQNVQLNESTLRHWLCNHDWEIVKGSGEPLKSNW